MVFFPDPSLSVLSQALDGLAHREQAVATNIANIDTPGYQPVSVDFETALRAAAAEIVPGGASTASEAAPGIPSAAVAMRTTDPRHFSSTDTEDPATSDTVQTFNGSTRNDGNTVDLESEMTALVDTQVRYSAVSKLVTSKLTMLGDAIATRGY